MLSKTERNYLLGIISPSYAHKRVLDHKIKKKIELFYKNELTLIQNSNVIDFGNTVTEFSNNKITCEAMRSPIYEGNQSLERGTNPRPNAYEAFALPG